MGLTSRLQALLNYANEKTGKDDANLGEAIRTLGEGYGQGGGETEKRWIRPSDWPDFSFVDWENFEGVYLVYDRELNPDGVIALNAVMLNVQTYFTIDIGYVRNNEFDIKYTEQRKTSATEATGANAMRKNMNEFTEERYIVARIKPSSTDAHITQIMFGTQYVGVQNTTSTYACTVQYCIERLARLPYLKTAGGNQAVMQSSANMIHEYWVDMGINTITSNVSCSYFFLNEINVECIEIINPTPKITTTTRMFSNCYKLYDLRINAPLVTNLTTNISYMFQNCYSLKKIEKAEDWDVSNVTTVREAFEDMHSLEELNMEKWNMVKTTDTLSSLFARCYSIKKINFNGWNLQNNSNVSINSIFYDCQKLEEVDFTNFNMSYITEISSAFRNCYHLKKIKFPLQDDFLPNYTNKMSTQTSYSQGGIAYTFYQCYALEELDLSRWPVDGKVKGYAYAFTNCYSLKKLKLPVISSYVSSSFTNLTFSDLRSLVDLEVHSFFENTLNFANTQNLSHQSLINILNALPTTSTKYVLTLGTGNKTKLTAEEIAIGTEKGWTIS